MKKIICLIFVCLILAGCKSEPAPVQQVVQPKPIILGIEIIEKTIHNYIGGSKPEGKYVGVEVKVINAGEETVKISNNEVYLKDNGNKYPIDPLVSYYREDRFSEIEIRPENEIILKLAFDVPEPNKDFKLYIKGKSADVK
ncbi:MAG: DUF4352 domain-containing protein [Candidatus Woesearchaeota archaeon]